MIVVSDASPLIALARIGAHEVLPALYGTVLIPRSVYEEVTLRAPDAPGARVLRQVRWFEVAEVQLPHQPGTGLDRGEADALALAIERGADLLLIDEQQGRRIARARGLKIVGTVGVLVEAARSGLIVDLRAQLDALRSEGFYLGDVLYEEALAALRRPESPR